MTHIEKLHLEAIESKVYVLLNKWQDPFLVDTDKAASKSAEITENISIEFAEWIFESQEYVWNPRLKKYILWRTTNPESNSKTSKELFQEYLKSKENDKSK